MNFKPILTALLWSVSFMLYAQSEPLSGTIIDRATNKPIQGAVVRANNNVDQFSETTDGDGNFAFRNIYAGSWKLTVSADGFNNYETSITMQSNNPLQMGLIYMYPIMTNTVVPDLGDLEDESDDDMQTGPTLLSSSQDVFANIASYKFGEMRFKTRGYDWNFGQTYVNGLCMNDINTGNSPFSLWGGLNDAMRNQEVSGGMLPTAYGSGAIGGTSNVITRASQIRKGFRVAYSNASTAYAHRLMLTYSNEIAEDLFLAVSASARYNAADNPLSWVTGAFYESFSYFVGLEKRLNDRQNLSLTFFGAPIKRGSQGASTQEVYDLMDDPYYNPNWGYQNGKVRNARVRNNHEPVAMLEYTNKLSNTLKLSAVGSFRFGKNSYSALDWYDAPDPRPDYYRYLPSYFINNLDPTLHDAGKSLATKEGWITNDNIRHINWEQLYNVNYNNAYVQNNATVNGNKGQTYSGIRSKYVIQERRTDQRDINFGTTLNALITNRLKINGGVNYRWNRTEYFNVMQDLLGGEYWVDVDQFAERDYPNSDAIQNDINNPNRIVKEGDKYGHDYYSFTQKGKAWAVANYTVGMLDAYLGGDLGFTSFYRDGLVRKGLFADNSYGKSAVNSFLTYSLQGGANYKITGNHVVSANVHYAQQAPYFQEAYISPRTRNTTQKNLSPENIFSTDLNYNLRMASAKIRLSGFYTTIKNQNKVMTFYDDLARTFSNYAMRGLDQQHAGVELGADVYIWKGISFKGALSYGEYIYTSNPLVTQTQDNNDQVVTDADGMRLEDKTVYWKNYHIPGTPQLAISTGLDYRAPRTWFCGIDLNYYDHSYVDISPVHRIYGVENANLTDEQRKVMLDQEKFDPGFVLNANVGALIYINQKYQLGINLSVSNILNNQTLRSGGYEQSRLAKYTPINSDTGLAEATRYESFDSKYYYMFGTTYFLNIFLRF